MASLMNSGGQRTQHVVPANRHKRKMHPQGRLL
jgi:hypothetical protein